MPSLAVVVSTLLWGTLWIPLRRLDAAGLSEAWATTAGFLLPLLLLLPLGVWRWRRIAKGGRPLAAAGFLAAVCIALYSEALLRGPVARVILLFYLTPVWSILLARLMLGVAVTPHRLANVALGLAGLLVVCDLGEALPVPRTVAEGMGLLSGVLWAFAMVYVRRLEHVADFDKTFVLFIFLGAVFFLVTLVPGGRTWTAPTIAVLLGAADWLVVLGAVWMPAVIWLTMFGGSRLDPGRVAILLTLEIVVGLASAAVLTDEPFGGRELLGALLVMAASGSEILGRPPS